MTPAKPTPILDGRSREWFDAAAAGKLLVQRCDSCGHTQFYPRAHCVECFSRDVGWLEAAGTGTLHTFTVVHRTPNAEFSDDCPYVLAIVELDEGPRVSSRIVDVPLDEIRCDMAVEAVFDRGDGAVVSPLFTKRA